MDTDDKDRLFFVEDMHQIGNKQIFEEEALDNRFNLQIVGKFISLFISFTLLSAISCFLNYKFEKGQAVNSFIIFGCSFFGDNFLLRPLFLIFLSLCKKSTFALKKEKEPKIMPMDQEQSSSAVTQNNLMQSSVTQLEGGEQEDEII